MELRYTGGMGEAPAHQPGTPPQERLPFSPGVGCLLSILVGLLCAGAFSLVLWLDRQGQVVYAPEPFRATRIWVLRGVEGRGLGISKTRPLPGATSESVCARTEVRFYFLGSAVPGADTHYCECYARGPSGWASAGACQE